MYPSASTQRVDRRLDSNVLAVNDGVPAEAVVTPAVVIKIPTAMKTAVHRDNFMFVPL
jgi:hypothetical protein